MIESIEETGLFLSGQMVMILHFFRVEIHVVLLGPLRNSVDVVLQR